eukprot:7121510-Pyramimonas_sp.AAC.1
MRRIGDVGSVTCRKRRKLPPSCGRRLRWVRSSCATNVEQRCRPRGNCGLTVPGGTRVVLIPPTSSPEPNALRA